MCIELAQLCRHNFSVTVTFELSRLELIDVRGNFMTPFPLTCLTFYGALECALKSADMTSVTVALSSLSQNFVEPWNLH